MCTLICKSYAISDDEEGKDGEKAGAAADAGGKAAAAATAAPESRLQM
jgi:hypothetical protein